MRRWQAAHLQLVGHQHGEGELEEIVVARAEELRPEEGREAALAEQGEPIGCGSWLISDGVQSRTVAVRTTRSLNPNGYPGAAPKRPEPRRGQWRTAGVPAAAIWMITLAAKIPSALEKGGR
jgi:hypothetical protein